MPPDTEIAYNQCGGQIFFSEEKMVAMMAFSIKLNQLPSWSKFSTVVQTHNPKDINQGGASMWAAAR